MPEPEEAPDEIVPPGWHRWYSERRKKYYYHNDATGEVQWTLPSIDTIDEEEAAPAAPTAAGQGAAAVRSLSSTAMAQTIAPPPSSYSASSSSAEAAPFVDPSPAPPAANGGASTNETVGLLQSLFPYYSYDDNTARLVQTTIPSVPRGDVDGTDALGNTLLLLATQYKAFDMVETLVNMGASVDARNAAGSSALHYACHYETFDENTVRLLVTRGAAVGAAESLEQGGLTPLHYAAETGAAEACRFLVARGADPAARDAYGRTPADCARDAGQDACAAAFASFEPPKASAALPKACTLFGEAWHVPVITLASVARIAMSEPTVVVVRKEL